MRIAARIVEKMHDKILEVIEPGMRKNELVAQIYSTAIIGAEGHGGDYPRSCRCCPPAPTPRRRT